MTRQTQTETTEAELTAIRFMEGTYEDRLKTLEEYALVLAKRLDKRPLPRLSTYTILTGEKYFVEATSEEEALDKFNNDEAEYIETDTQVIGND